MLCCRDTEAGTQAPLRLGRPSGPCCLPWSVQGPLTYTVYHHTVSFWEALEISELLISLNRQLKHVSESALSLHRNSASPTRQEINSIRHNKWSFPTLIFFRLKFSVAMPLEWIYHPLCHPSPFNPVLPTIFIANTGPKIPVCREWQPGTHMAASSTHSLATWTWDSKGY